MYFGSDNQTGASAQVLDMLTQPTMSTLMAMAMTAGLSKL